jgi:hypothetical protein
MMFEESNMPAKKWSMRALEAENEIAAYAALMKAREIVKEPTVDTDLRKAAAFYAYHFAQKGKVSEAKLFLLLDPRFASASNIAQWIQKLSSPNLNRACNVLNRAHLQDAGPDIEEALTQARVWFNLSDQATSATAVLDAYNNALSELTYAFALKYTNPDLINWYLRAEEATSKEGRLAALIKAMTFVPLENATEKTLRANQFVREMAYWAYQGCADERPEEAGISILKALIIQKQVVLNLALEIAPAEMGCEKAL